METHHVEHGGHKIILRPQRNSVQNARALLHKPIAELLIDEKIVRYECLHNGLYCLPDYAYDWQSDLLTLAKKYLDYQAQTKSQINVVRTSLNAATHSSPTSIRPTW